MPSTPALGGRGGSAQGSFLSLLSLLLSRCFLLLKRRERMRESDGNGGEGLTKCGGAKMSRKRKGEPYKTAVEQAMRDESLIRSVAETQGLTLRVSVIRRKSGRVRSAHFQFDDSHGRALVQWPILRAWHSAGTDGGDRRDSAIAERREDGR